MIHGVKYFVSCIFLAVSSIVSQAQARPASAQGSSSGNKQVEDYGCLDRKAGKFELTNGFWWVVYYLTGQTAGLQNHIGDELKVRGIETSPGSPGEPSKPQDRIPPTLQVSSVEVVTRKNPNGVPPVLGSPASWVHYDNSESGIRLQYPARFKSEQGGYPPVSSNFAGEASTTHNPVVGVSIPRDIYPDSNFADGNFTAFANPNITSEGTCKQFGRFWPEHTGSTTVNGITYSRTYAMGPAMGTDYGGYAFHTFQNGLCYEFSFNFAEQNGTGMDMACTTQWVSDKNELELMQAVLSTVSFTKPRTSRLGSEHAQHDAVPSVTLFEHESVVSKPAGAGHLKTVTLSWRTAGTDYVQIHYPCTKLLYASTTSPNTFGLGKCGEQTDVNLPPNGSMTLLLSNFDPRPIELVLTLEPFRQGAGYRKESKTISITAPPHDPVPKQQDAPPSPVH
jgi:hypothetical protein